MIFNRNKKESINSRKKEIIIEGELRKKEFLDRFNHSEIRKKIKEVADFAKNFDISLSN